MTVSDSPNLIALPPGFRLGEYRIEGYLGSGGFGITYAAIDENLNGRVAVKEYLPKAFAMRGADDRVTVVTAEDEADFRWGLDRFLDEARALARFDHPNIVSVKRYIEAQGTAYIVMEHVDGESLSDLLNCRPTLNEAEIREHVLPVADGLAEVHRAGLLHRDIKPGNIVVRANGVPVLIDFGSARREASARSRSLTAVITPGYAPLEQYSSSLGDEQPATDIYAFGAVLYRCVTGDSPPDATDRALEDRLTSSAQAADGIYSPGLLTAIDAALHMRADERPRDIAAFLRLVSTGDIRGERPEDAGARHGETAYAARAGPGLGRAGRNVAHSNEGGSSANREKAGRSARWALWAPAMIIAVILGAFVFATFLDLRGGEGTSSDWRPAPAVTSEPPSLGEPPRSVLPVAERDPVDSPPLSSFTVEAEPPHAHVRITNIAPVYEPGIMLAAGSYTVEASAPGYETVTEAVRHDVTTPTVHRVALAVAPQPITITASPAAARIRFQDDALSYRPGMELPPGNYAIEVTAARHRPFVGEVEHVLVPGRHTNRHIELRLLWEPGHVFRDCPNCPQMVVIPGTRGSEDTDGQESFAMGVHEVTRWEFARFVGETGHEPPNECWVFDGDTGSLRDERGWQNPGFEQTDRHPVVCLSRSDAEAYVQWLSARTGAFYRMPTEPEWEYAANAGREIGYLFGEEERRVCVYGTRNQFAPQVFRQCERHFARPEQVGGTGPNGFGLFDVNANVWEWTDTCETVEGKKRLFSRPATETACTVMDVRGHLWRATPWRLRSAFNIGYPRDFSYSNLGFRVARALEGMSRTIGPGHAPPPEVN